MVDVGVEGLPVDIVERRDPVDCRGRGARSFTRHIYLSIEISTQCH
jgi:hypothetical protein